MASAKEYGKTHMLESFGVVYAVVVAPGVKAFWRVALPPDTKRLRTVTPQARFSLERDGKEFRLVVDGTFVGSASTERTARDLLEGEIALFVASQAPRRVFVHAGVVVWKGKAMVFPGRSMAGKSTLVAALLARGATFYSDEYAVIDERGLVHAYPRKLSMRQRSGLPKRVRARRTGRRPVPVGWVLGLKYDGNQTLRMTSLTAGRTALLLLDNAVAARISPARVLATVAKVAESAEGAAGLRGDAKRVAATLLARCETSTDVVSVRRRRKPVRVSP